ncbi:MAG: restriction endonuclease subunit S [Paludibacter sp.]|nr:restriction endonuclease subunit S [Paludibacter sp.]
MSKQENQLPQGWEVKKLGEVCDFQNGFAFQSKLYKESGLPILRITNIQNDEINTKELVFFNTKDYKVNLDRFKVFQGDLLIAMSGATTGKLGINNSETVFYLNQRVGKFIPMKHLNKIFLYYFLTTKVEESLRIAIGAAQPNLSTEQIYSFEIPLPPLPEQQRIVSILDEAFAAIAKAKANAEQNLKNARELFDCYLQRVFEIKGEGWEEKKLGDLATFRNGMNFTKGSNGEVIKIVGVKDFQQSFYVPFETLEYATIDGKLNETDILKDGDILAVRSNGNPSLIGRTLLAYGVHENVSHSGFTIRIRLNTNLLSPIYLCNYLKTKKTRKELIDSGNGVGIKSLNQGSLSSLLIPYPKSLKEQQAIVQKLDSLSTETQKLETVYRKKIADLEELKKSLLQKAFSGEL